MKVIKRLVEKETKEEKPERETIERAELYVAKDPRKIRGTTSVLQQLSALEA